MMTFPARHISISINRSASEVYEFASTLPNLPQWAAGLGGAIQQIDGGWFADSPMGRVKIAFAEKNRFGVLDHDVTLPSGQTVYNPMRVFPNDGGSELIFTLFRRDGVSDQAFAADAELVEQDLQRLKKLIER